MPTPLILNVGRTPDNRWCEPRRLTARDASNCTDAPSSAAVQSDLKNCSTHRGRIEQMLDYLETYKMNID